MSRSMVRAVLVASALAAVSSLASAEDIESVLANHYKARGGLDKLKALQSVKMTGTLAMGEMQAPFVMYGARPNKLRIEFQVMGMTGLQGYDGTTAWMLMPFMGQKNAEAMPPDQARAVADQADFDGPLVDWEAKGNKVELLGKEAVDGTDAYKLKVTTHSGDVRTIYLDAEAYLQIKESVTRTVREKEMTSNSAMSDYKEVSGVLFPFAMENSSPGAPGSQKLVFEKIDTNIDTGAVQFSMPAKTEGGEGGKPNTGGPAGDVQHAGAAATDSTSVATHATSQPSKTGAATTPKDGKPHTSKK